MEPLRIAIIGVGLIGGSVALAARERVGAEVVGWDRSARALDAALEVGAIDRAATDLPDALTGARAAFIAAPVGALADAVTAALRAAGDDCVVTDVGSTKRAVIEAISDPRFIGGHPLAGAPDAGVQSARADLFDGATWYLTPTQRTDGGLYERLHRLLSALGARPAAIDAETHDRMVATVSHLPHVLANVLVEQAARTRDEEGEQLPEIGGSFRGIARIAGVNTAIWRDIYLANADALIGAIDDAQARLTAVRALLFAADGEALGAWNDAAAEDRRRLLESEAGGEQLHELRTIVPNRPGIVAEVALALGRESINIVDMALSPTADGTSGYITLWIAGSDRADRALALISGLNLSVTRA